MSQGPFNPDFTDKDADRLCEIASIANDPQYRYYTCGWVTGQVICSSFVQVADFPDHLRSHGLVGSEQTKVKCCWVSCSADMKKESLVRHVNEKHLELRYACPNCPEQFTRPYSLQCHMSKKHPIN